MGLGARTSPEPHDRDHHAERRPEEAERGGIDEDDLADLIAVLRVRRAAMPPPNE